MRLGICILFNYTYINIPNTLHLNFHYLTAPAEPASVFPRKLKMIVHCAARAKVL